jgi:hypothetical protein
VVEGLRMVVVTGPRIDPDTVPPADGLEVHRWMPDLHRRLAACDLAITHGGLTTTMELTAHRRPFLYVPLRRHFEQCRHVPHHARPHCERLPAGRARAATGPAPATSVVESHPSVPSDSRASIGIV